jgi:hypothetical protein
MLDADVSDLFVVSELVFLVVAVGPGRGVMTLGYRHVRIVQVFDVDLPLDLGRRLVHRVDNDTGKRQRNEEEQGGDEVFGQVRGLRWGSFARQLGCRLIRSKHRSSPSRHPYRS